MAIFGINSLDFWGVRLFTPFFLVILWRLLFRRTFWMFAHIGTPKVLLNCLVCNFSNLVQLCFGGFQRPLQPITTIVFFFFSDILGS